MDLINCRREKHALFVTLIHIVLKFHCSMVNMGRQYYNFKNTFCISASQSMKLVRTFPNITGPFPFVISGILSQDY